MREDSRTRLNVSIRLASPLRVHAGGSSVIVLDVGAPATMRSLLDAVEQSYPPIERRIRDETGKVRQHVNLFIGSDNIRDLDGLDTPIDGRAEVSVLPAISGG